MDTAEVREAVHEVVLDVVSERNPGTTSLDDTSRLQDLGLRSLDLAQIVAMLEERLGCDPFAELVSVTSVRTVGDITNAYRAFFSGEGPKAPALDEALQRGNRRLEAANKRQGK